MVRFRPRRRWVVAASAAIAALLATAVVGRMLAADRLLEELRRALRDRYGLETGADDVTLSLLHGTAVIEGLRIRDGPVTVLEAARVEIDARTLDVLRRRFDITRLALLRPVLRIVVEPDGRTNLKRILSAPPKGPPRPDRFVVLRATTIEDGRVEISDAVTDPDRPGRLVAHHLGGALGRWPFAGEPVTGSPADLQVDGEIDQPGSPARISVVAWSSTAGGTPAWTLLAAVTGFDLREVPRYVGAGARTALGGAFLHLAVDIRSRGGAIGPGAITGEVATSGTVLSMRVGGTTGAPVFESGSALAILLGVPLSLAGRLGAVTLDGGWSAVKGGAGAVVKVGGGVVDAGVSLGTGLVDAGGDVLSGDPLGALAAAGGGVLGVVTSLGGGLLAGAGSLVGGGVDAAGAFAGADGAEIDRRFTALHTSRRLAMLGARGRVPAHGRPPGTR